jgi:hypothetical protein
MLLLVLLSALLVYAEGEFCNCYNSSEFFHGGTNSDIRYSILSFIFGIYIYIYNVTIYT